MTALLQQALQSVLPADSEGAALACRVWRPDAGGPSVAVIAGAPAYDVSGAYPTMRDLCEAAAPATEVQRLARERQAAGERHRLGTVEELATNAVTAARRPELPWLLPPTDLQAVKASGVTFAASLLERVIEERAAGDPAAAAAMRSDISAAIGGDLRSVKPGSPEAMELKALLQKRGLWSQYLEVGIGPDAEIFTKAQILSPVSCGEDAGVHPMSRWNNPEPEVVLVISSTGRIVGATLGNDVNLRDVEGRSALLLGRAKDNNASCAVGPVVRFFDDRFSLQDVRRRRRQQENTGRIIVMQRPTSGRRFRQHLLGTTSVMCVVCAGPVAAQQVAQLDEIIVTAQEREQLLQDVPVSVSAFGESAIEALRIDSAVDYVEFVPNVTFQQLDAFRAVVSIRGAITMSVA